MDTKEEIKLVRTVNHWKSGRLVLEEFLRVHPELGIKYTENVYNNIVRIQGPRLAEMDVMRKSGMRSPALFDISKFDSAAFDLLTKAHQISRIRSNKIMQSGTFSLLGLPHDCR